MFHNVLDSLCNKMTNITLCDDNTKVGALCISIQGTREDTRGAFIFDEIRLSLGEIS